MYNNHGMVQAVGERTISPEAQAVPNQESTFFHSDDDTESDIEIKSGGFSNSYHR